MPTSGQQENGAADLSAAVVTLVVVIAVGAGLPEGLRVSSQWMDLAGAAAITALVAFAVGRLWTPIVLWRQILLTVCLTLTVITIALFVAHVLVTQPGRAARGQLRTRVSMPHLDGATTHRGTAHVCVRTGCNWRGSGTG